MYILFLHEKRRYACCIFVFRYFLFMSSGCRVVWSAHHQCRLFKLDTLCRKSFCRKKYYYCEITIVCQVPSRLRYDILLVQFYVLHISVLIVFQFIINLSIDRHHQQLRKTSRCLSTVKLIPPVLGSCQNHDTSVRMGWSSWLFANDPLGFSKIPPVQLDPPCERVLRSQLCLFS